MTNQKAAIVVTSNLAKHCDSQEQLFTRYVIVASFSDE